jgi:hypothetical protein
MRRRALGVVSAVLCVALPARFVAGQTPVLRYDPPAGFFGGGGTKDTWISNSADGLISIYQFEPFTGSFRDQFARTLFVDRIDQQSRETRIVRQPFGDTITVPGAESAILLRFVADHSGYVREHARLAVLSQGAVAVIDISSSSADAWTRNWPGALGVLKSVHVEVEKPRPVTAASMSAMRDVAGLYIGSSMVFQANPMGTVGSGRWVAGTKWYLLSPDGKVQSGYKLPQAPDGDITRFDYDAARRADPGFGGTYFIEGNQITLKLGNETVVADRTPKGIAIRGTSYEKMDLKKQN